MEYIRISAKTVDDALMEASIQFGTSSDNIEYEVVEKGSSGFLGFGSKPAVIMARKKEEVPEESFEEAAEEPVKKAEEKEPTIQEKKCLSWLILLPWKRAAHWKKPIPLL